MAKPRSSVVSSFTIIKGSLIDETYAVFRDWDFGKSRTENLQRVRENNTIGTTSAHWARDVAKVINRRFDPAGRDRPLVDLPLAGCDRDVWKPILLFHMTRDEFLVRDFLHAMADVEPNARRIVDAEDWRMFLMDTSDVERELLRLHQFRKVHYEVAGRRLRCFARASSRQASASHRFLCRRACTKPSTPRGSAPRPSTKQRRRWASNQPSRLSTRS